MLELTLIGVAIAAPVIAFVALPMIVRRRDETGPWAPSYDGAKHFLELVLKLGNETAFVAITHRPSERWIQFRKYIHAVGDYGLELAFPNAEWSRPYFQRLREQCEANRLPWRMVDETQGDTMTFLYVDCGRDAQASFDLGKSIFTQIFGVSLEEEYRFDSHGYASVNKLIDSPGHPTATCRSMDLEIRQESGIGPLQAVRLAVQVYALICGVLGLVLRLSFADWSWHRVAIDLLAQTLSVSMFDLLCIAGIIAGYAAIHTLRGLKHRPIDSVDGGAPGREDSGRTWRKPIRRLCRFGLFGMTIAVIVLAVRSWFT
jgi:hypothetical protein